MTKFLIYSINGKEGGGERLKIRSPILRDILPWPKNKNKDHKIKNNTKHVTEKHNIKHDCIISNFSCKNMSYSY